MNRNQRAKWLTNHGFTVGARDPRANRAFKGSHMVIEAHDDDELPTNDGRDGPWCIVGDNLNALIDEAFDCFYISEPGACWP